MSIERDVLGKGRDFSPLAKRLAILGATILVIIQCTFQKETEASIYNPFHYRLPVAFPYQAVSPSHFRCEGFQPGSSDYYGGHADERRVARYGRMFTDSCLALRNPSLRTSGCLRSNCFRL